jgi:hypothetical protein
MCESHVTMKYFFLLAFGRGERAQDSEPGVMTRHSFSGLTSMTGSAGDCDMAVSF